MTAIALPHPSADRFAAILGAFRRVVAAEAAKNRLFESVLCLVWSRIGRIAQRIARLASRIPEDAPPRPHRVIGPRASAMPGRPQTRNAAPNRFASLPRRAGWLLRFVPASAYPAKSQLRALFAEPETARLIAASPGIRRQLRPLCRMLGLDPPPSPEPARIEPPSPEPKPPEPQLPERGHHLPSPRRAAENSATENGTAPGGSGPAGFVRDGPAPRR